MKNAENTIQSGVGSADLVPFETMVIGQGFRIFVVALNRFLDGTFFKTGSESYGTRPDEAIWEWRGEFGGMVEPISVSYVLDVKE